MGPDFFLKDAGTVARRLLGCVLSRITDDGTCLSGQIVETEAYPPGDPASHAFRGETARNHSMFLEGGRCYVYRIYGVHRCMNVVTGPEGIGAAVLIRALEPLEGLEVMRRRRFGSDIRRKLPEKQLKNLCSGPGKLCQALGISVGEHDGTDLIGDPASGALHISPGRTISGNRVSNSMRIGLSAGRGDAELLRWYLNDSQFCSLRGSTQLRN
jgi:DNA-3-methyladenine glycosylase